MIKQIFGKLPRKPSSKSSHGDTPPDGIITVAGRSSSEETHFAVGSPSIAAQAGAGNGALGFAASYQPLPSFRDVPSSEKPGLFLRKLAMCCVVFDFSDPAKNAREKEIKRQMLLELVDYISTVTVKFNEAAMQEATKMVAANIFRTFSSSAGGDGQRATEGFEAEEEEPAMEPAWPHLQIVYEFFLRFIASGETDAKVAKRYVDHSFILSIINGFALPLKEEHKLFLVRALIPLHKPKCLALYHQQLSYCITQFVEKDNKLADTVIRGLLKYWPITNSSKEVMFLGELEEVLEATQEPEFQRCMVPLFRQIARCLNSSHFQVAERSLFLWNNDHVRNLITLNRKMILPIIFPALERNLRGHWNQAVQGLTLNVRKLFLDADQELFEECSLRFQESEAKEKEKRAKRELTWERLEDIAASKAISKEAVLVSQKFSFLGIPSSTSPRMAAGT
ncbi:hypothetical protein HPP92_003378 [Vanilla planifolia]|uniref:Serine/threonine protein phosphatase 2A regulatory subunit n=1 Tax=Vanilla planifolia TaxID=51239 RepID=A0A835VNK7_VANPL|nr:hypothetical protein HPP92_003378 [Vanilla planifolia]